MFFFDASFKSVDNPARWCILYLTATKTTDHGDRPMTTSNRTFGVEIELVGLGTWDAARALTSAGLSAAAESYNHTTRSHWKVVTDASVPGGCEVVSPILSGYDGLRDLTVAMRALEAAGARINRSCGLHVHVGIGDLNPKQIKGVVGRYLKLEPIIDAWMPQSRRGSGAMYCASNTQLGNHMNGEEQRYAVNQTLAALRFARDDVASIWAAATPGARASRYHKLNLASYWRQGTIEFRQHSGTVDALKATNWVRFLLALVEKGAAAPGVPGDARNAYNGARETRWAMSIAGAPSDLTTYYKERARRLAA